MRANRKIFIGVGTLILLAMLVLVYSQRLHLFRFLPAESSKNYSISDDGLMVNTETGTPFSGRLRSKDDDRTDFYSYKNGLLEGMNVSYRNGEIAETGYWKNNLQDGHFQLYSEDGILLDDAFFKEGKRHGVTKQYHYTNGRLRVVATYVNGQLEGECTQYNESGIITIKAEYSRGALNGKSTHYYNDGKIKLEANFTDGISVGDAIFWYPEGIQVKGTIDFEGTFIPHETKSYLNIPINGVLIKKYEGEYIPKYDNKIIGLAIDDLIYTVPVSVKRFLDDGWKMTNKMPSFDLEGVIRGYYEKIFKLYVTEEGTRLYSGGTTIRLFEKNGSLLELTIENQSQKGIQTPVEDCVVIGIAAHIEHTTNRVKIKDVPLDGISQNILLSLFPAEDGWVHYSYPFDKYNYIRQHIGDNTQYIEGYFKSNEQPLGIHVHNRVLLLE